MASVAISGKFDDATSDDGGINSSNNTASSQMIPHTINDLPTFIGRIGRLKASLDGPVTKPGSGLALDRSLWISSETRTDVPSSRSHEHIWRR